MWISDRFAITRDSLCVLTRHLVREREIQCRLKRVRRSISIAYCTSLRFCGRIILAAYTGTRCNAESIMA